MQERVYRGRKFENVEQLKQAILLEWRALSQRFIDGSINSGGVACRVSYRPENGGHIRSSTIAVDICTLPMWFVADVRRDNLQECNI